MSFVTMRVPTSCDGLPQWDSHSPLATTILRGPLFLFTCDMFHTASVVTFLPGPVDAGAQNRHPIVAQEEPTGRTRCRRSTPPCGRYGHRGLLAALTCLRW